MARMSHHLHSLAHLPLFAGCDRGQLELASSLLTEVNVGAGEIIIREHSAAREAFIVASGTVVVESGHGETARQLAIVGVGEPLGEMAILRNMPRTATVTTTSATTLLAATPRELMSLIHGVPSVGAKIVELADRRQRLNDAA